MAMENNIIINGQQWNYEEEIKSDLVELFRININFSPKYDSIISDVQMFYMNKKLTMIVSLKISKDAAGFSFGRLNLIKERLEKWIKATEQFWISKYYEDVYEYPLLFMIVEGSRHHNIILKDEFSFYD